MTSPVKVVSGAELKATLNGLGLPPSWFAEHMSVTMRTVVRWFDGDTVSAVVAEELNRIRERAAEETRRILAAVEDDEDPVVLETYRTDETVVRSRHGRWPASWHRMATFRAMEQLRAQGRPVVVRYR